MTRPTEPEANETPCERTEPLLSAYLLDELADGDREAVASHIAGCAHCREELEMLASAVTALRAIQPLEAGLEPAGREKILAAARESAAASRGRRPRVIYLALGGLAAAAVLVALLVPGLVSFEHGKPIEVARAPEPARVKAVDELRAFEKLPADPAGAKGPGTDPAALAGEARSVAQEFSEPALAAGAGVASDTSGTRRLDESAAKSDEKLKLLALARNEAVVEKEKTDAFLVAGEPAKEAPDLAFREAMPEAAKAGSADGLADGGRESRQLAKRLTVAEQLRRETETPAALQDAPVQKAKRAGFRSGAPAKPSPEAEREQLLGRELATGLESKQDLGAAPTAEDLKQAPEKASELTTRAESPSRVYRSRGDAAERPREPTLNGTGGGAAGAYGARWQEAQKAAAESAPPAPAARPASAAALSTAAPGDKPAQAAPGQGLPAPATPALVDNLQKDPAAPAETDRLAAMPPGGAAGGATTAPVPPPDWRARVDEFLSRLDRRPGETPGMMFFRYWGTNPFVEASSDPLSTFAVDVDTASYTIARAYFYDRGMLPPREAIRTEEFVNFFKSRYAPPAADGPAFAVHAEMAPSPFAHEADYQLLKVGLKGREIPKEKRKACGLVFVIDTSGSMRQGNRLELVKEALRLLVPELDEGDTVGIVAFDREARVILDPVPASEKERILDAISRLEPRQNTNVAAGLEMGYQMAARHKVRDGSNRVLLLSDGVANTGNVDPVAMTEKVRAEREQGIYLTCVGVGMGNMNDSLMETLADRGNGQCVYVDRIEQAKKAFVDNLTGTLEAIAKDAKIQVEFDPAKVIRYRLLGYENRDIADAQFRDNKVDAGEVGAGHEVTALYELKLKPNAGDTLATIRVRYLTVDHGEAVEIARPVTPEDRRKAISEASPRFQVSACAAELAEVLRGSYWARGSTLDKVAAILEPILGAADGPSGGKLGDDNDVIELIALAKKADALVRERDARADDIARTSDAIKENYLLRAQIEDAQRARANDNRAQLDSILQQNDALRRRLEELLRG